MVLVEGDKPSDAVSLECGSDPRVMSILANDRVLCDQAPPQLICCLGVVFERKDAFKLCQNRFGLGSAQFQSVIFPRSCSDNPKFIERLRQKKNFCSSGN